MIKTLSNLLKKKWSSFLVLALLMFLYVSLPHGPGNGVPFAELLYTVILIASVLVVGPLFRLLVFPNAAALAESGRLAKLLDEPKPVTQVLHYWIATFISYLVTLLCISSLL